MGSGETKLNRYMKSSMSLIIREMQIKTTVRYHFTPVRMTIVNKSTASVGEDVEKGEPGALLVGLQIGAATREDILESPQKIKNRITL